MTVLRRTGSREMWVCSECVTVESMATVGASGDQRGGGRDEKREQGMVRGGGKDVGECDDVTR